MDVAQILQSLSYRVCSTTSLKIWIIRSSFGDTPLHTDSLLPCCEDICHSPKSYLKPGLHIVVMVVSTVANMFLTLFQAVLIHVDTLITTSQALPAGIVINCSVCNDRSNH